MFDTSTCALEYFQLFCSDEVFEKFVNFTNLNARTKRAADPTQKGVWTNVTLPELKAYYGLLILMDIMKFQWDELCWNETQSAWLIGSKFGVVMSRDCFIQIKRYLHFSDDTDNKAKQNKLHKVRFFIRSPSQNFQRRIYMSDQEISVDEAMVPFKGHLGLIFIFYFSGVL